MIKRLFKRSDNTAPSFENYTKSKPVFIILSLIEWPRQRIRAMYAWVVKWAETKYAERALAGVSFAESSFFPIPPDPLLIAMTTVKPKKYLRFATICTLASVAGGILGYLIGVGLFETVGQPIINAYNMQEQFDLLGDRFTGSALLVIFTAGFTPIPYKVFTIAAGVFRVNFAVFLLASLLGRAGRFFIVAFLMHHFGKRYKDKIEKYVDILSILFVVLVILGVLAIRFI